LRKSTPICVKAIISVTPAPFRTWKATSLGREIALRQTGHSAAHEYEQEYDYEYEYGWREGLHSHVIHARGAVDPSNSTSGLAGEIEARGVAAEDGVMNIAIAEREVIVDRPDDLLVACREETDRPVTAEHEAFRAECLEGNVEVRTEIGRAP
jgi:hypothetical protein